MIFLKTPWQAGFVVRDYYTFGEKRGREYHACWVLGSVNEDLVLQQWRRVRFTVAGELVEDSYHRQQLYVPIYNVTLFAEQSPNSPSFGHPSLDSLMDYIAEHNSIPGKVVLDYGIDPSDIEDRLCVITEDPDARWDVFQPKSSQALTASQEVRN